jgi:hypothetical protein
MCEGVEEPNHYEELYNLDSSQDSIRLLKGRRRTGWAGHEKRLRSDNILVQNPERK